MHHDAATLVDQVVDMETAMRNLSSGLFESASLEDAAAVFIKLQAFQQDLARIMSLFTSHIADLMGGNDTFVVEGGGTLMRHGKKDRTKWDKDSLLRAVLDSRKVDKDTGFISEETPLDKVLAVWNLPAPRITELRARGIDADEFCSSEWGGYSIQVMQAGQVA